MDHLPIDSGSALVDTTITPVLADVLILVPAVLLVRNLGANEAVIEVATSLDGGALPWVSLPAAALGELLTGATGQGVAPGGDVYATLPLDTADRYRFRARGLGGQTTVRLIVRPLSQFRAFR